MFLLDTNVISEPKRLAPSAGVLRWLTGQSPSDLHISVLTIGEIRKGLLRLDPGSRRSDLGDWLDTAVTAFEDRILAVDTRVAEAWAQVNTRHRAQGAVVDVIDELIAATALAHDLTLVTRNVRHFDQTGCRLFSPWAE